MKSSAQHNDSRARWHAPGEGERQRAGGRGTQGEGERQRAGGRGTQVLALTGLALIAVSSTVAIVLLAFSWRIPTPPPMFGPRGFATVFGLVSGGAGVLIAYRRPGNAIGWVLLVSALFAATQGLGEAYALYALGAGGDPPPMAAWGAWTSEWMWIVYLEAIGVIAAIFPDGRWRSRRWRAVIVSGCVGSLAATVANALTPDLVMFSSFDNPVGLRGVEADAYIRIVAAFTWVFGYTVILAGAASAAARFRHARGDERQQLKWLALAAALVAAATTTVGVVMWAPGFTGLTPPGFEWSENLAVASIVGLPVAIAIAVLRYRLYDIDVIINRALVYSAITAVLAVSYAGVVLGLQALLPGVARDSSVAVAMSTLAMVALFRPLRRRAQNLVDRSFYRRRYDAENTVERFGAQLRDERDLAALQSSLIAVAGDTMQPAHTSLWLRPPTPSFWAGQVSGAPDTPERPPPLHRPGA